MICGVFLSTLRRLSHVNKASDRATVSPVLTGLMERFFFTILVAVKLPGVAGAMIAWIAVKMASNWNSDNEQEDRRFNRFAALLTGLLSMSVATIGGLYISTAS